jgi:hypothetical protein
MSGESGHTSWNGSLLGDKFVSGHSQLLLEEGNLFLASHLFLGCIISQRAKPV